MTAQLWKEVVAIVVRYWAPILIAALFHGMPAEQQGKLVAAMTSPEMLALYATTTFATGLALRAWWKKTQFGLTAAAMSGPATSAQVVAAMKAQGAPALSTPTDQIPQLQITNEPKE